jgi:hypothetical protein
MLREATWAALGTRLRRHAGEGAPEPGAAGVMWAQELDPSGAGPAPPATACQSVGPGVRCRRKELPLCHCFLGALSVSTA